jgi:hypothetical protein
MFAFFPNCEVFNQSGHSEQRYFQWPGQLEVRCRISSKAFIQLPFDLTTISKRQNFCCRSKQWAAHLLLPVKNFSLVQLVALTCWRYSYSFFKKRRSHILLLDVKKVQKANLIFRGGGAKGCIIQKKWYYFLPRHVPWEL